MKIRHSKLLIHAVSAGLLLASLQGCVEPRTTRTLPQKSTIFTSPGTFNTGNTTTETSGTTGTGTGSIGTGSGTGNTGTGSGTGTVNNNVPADAKHCSWSSDGMTGYQYSHTHLGVFSFCRSSTTENRVYIQVKTPITDSYLCVIPTTSVGQNSTYIGGPRCQLVNDPIKIYPIDLLKNRNGYTNYSMTGTMIMKDKLYYYPPPFNQNLLSPDAYLYCSQWLAATGDSSYCQAFVSVGQYVYHKFQ